MSWWPWSKKPIVPKVQPHCVPLSIMCAWSWGTTRKDQVRMAVTHISSGIDHVQAQALIDGKWTYLSEFWAGSNLEIRPYQSHYPDIEPFRYVTLAEWIKEQIVYTNQGDL